MPASTDRTDGEIETLVEEETVSLAMTADTPPPRSIESGRIISSQPEALRIALCIEPPPVTAVAPFAVSSLIEVLPVVRMEHAPSVVTSQTAASSVSERSSPVRARSENPPAVAARLLSVSDAEVWTSVVPMLVSPVAVTCGVRPPYPVR